MGSQAGAIPKFDPIARDGVCETQIHTRLSDGRDNVQAVGVDHIDFAMLAVLKSTWQPALSFLLSPSPRCESRLRRLE